MRMFRKSERLQDVAAVAEQFKPSPLIAVFEGAYSELRKQAPHPIRVGALQRAIQIASSEELTRLESRLPWLATTGAVTPFIGLFGTVWGIIDAFHGLGTAGAATLRAVAPGISEALITTAAGLFAAIPAVIAYNMFTQHIREFGARMDDFGLELVNEVERAQSGVARQFRKAWSGGNGLHQRAGTHPDLALRHQRHAAGGRRAGVAHHLHGDRAGVAVGN